MPQIETELMNENVRVPCSMHIAYIDNCKYIELVLILTRMKGLGCEAATRVN